MSNLTIQAADATVSTPSAQDTPMSPIQIASSPMTDEKRGGIVRVHLDEQTDLIASSEQSEPSNQPIMPAAAAATNGASRAYGEATDSNLGPAPGPTVAVVQSSAVSSGINNKSAAAEATQPSSSSAAVSASSQSSLPATPNPHNEALSTALSTALRSLNPSYSASTMLAHTLDQISALDFSTKTKYFTLVTTPSPATEAVFHALMQYFLDDEHSGSPADPVCKFLYDAYWETSSKFAATSTEMPALPAQHLFLLNILPLLLYKFQMKLTTATSTSSYAGLFTVFLAIYNTERVLSARTPGKSILARPRLPDLPELVGLPQTDLDGIKHSMPNVLVPVEILPMIVEPAQHTSVLLHVLMKKTTLHFSALLEEARQATIFALGLLASSGQPGDAFADVLQSSSDAEKPSPPSLALEKLAVRWPTSWRQDAGAPAPPRRFVLSTELLQAGLIAITYQLENAARTHGPAREFVLAALRQVHCRAIEDLRPQVLLQTTVLLEFEEQAILRRQMVAAR